jgi:WD40 repeat protein
VVEGYLNGEVIVWDWSTGEKVQTLLGADTAIWAKNFAGPDGDSVMTIGRYGGPDTEVDGLPDGFRMVAWDIESGEQIYRYDGARGERRFEAVSTPDNRIALISASLFDEQGSNTGLSRLLIVDLETGEVLAEPALAELDGNNYIESIAVNPAGDQAFAIITDVDSEAVATGVFISLPSAEVGATVIFDTDVDFARYSPDSSQIVVVINDSSQRYFTLLDAMTGESIRQLGSRSEGHGGEVNIHGLAFTPDGKRLVTGDAAGGVVVWDVETGQLIQRLFSLGQQVILTVNVSPDGNTAITAGDGGMRFWDITQDTTAQVFEGHEAEINYAVAISPDGTQAISTGFSFSGGENEAILWDTRTLEVIYRLPGFFLSAEFLPDGRSAILGGDVTAADENNPEMLLVHWDIESGEVLNRRESADLPMAHDIAISPDGSTFLSASGRAHLLQFDIETLTQTKSFPLPEEEEVLRSVAISPDGHRALAGSILSGFSLGDIILFDLDTGEIIRRYNQEGSWAEGLDFSADGERFVSTGNDLTLVLWDVASGEAIQTFNGHVGSVSDVAFTPDESQIISASADGTLILWDVATGEALRTYSEHGAWVNNLALSPDGQLAYSAADDGTVIVRPIVPIPVDDILAHIADNRVLHDFTCVERERYRILPLCDADGIVPESGN